MPKGKKKQKHYEEPSSLRADKLTKAGCELVTAKGRGPEKRWVFKKTEKLDTLVKQLDDMRKQHEEEAGLRIRKPEGEE